MAPIAIGWTGATAGILGMFGVPGAGWVSLGVGAIQVGRSIQRGDGRGVLTGAIPSVTGGVGSGLTRGASRAGQMADPMKVYGGTISSG